MPMVRLQPRSAFIFFLYFPWFPFSPPLPPEAQPQTVAMETDAAGESQTAASVVEEPLALPGVVIEEVPKGSALEKAGLQVEDVILSWERLPNPPANSEGAKGELISYFDWQELEVEQVPRGAVLLYGQRGKAPLELTVEPGMWKAKIRPVLSQALEEFYLAGKAQLAIGDIETAVRTWDLISKHTDIGGTSDLRVWVALRTGEAWEEKVEWEKVVGTFREALEIATSPLARAELLKELGIAHDELNDYEAAEKAHMSELELRQLAHQESLALAASMNRLARVAYRKGFPDRARAYTLRALQIQEKLAPGSLSVADSLSNLGTLAWIRGDLGAAHSYDIRALELNERLAPESLKLAKSLHNLGALAQDQGDLARAHAYSLRALSLQEQLAPKSLDLASTLNNLGVIALARWDLDSAGDYLLRSLQIEEQLAPQSLTIATALSNLGILSVARGDFARAHAYLLRSLKIEETLAPQSLAVATSLNNLGCLAAENNELGLANEYHLQALQIRKHLAPQTLPVANSLYNLGRVAQDQGKLERANNYYLQALSIQERLSPESLDLASSVAGVATIAKRQGKLAIARDYYMRALRISEQLAPQSLSVAIYQNHLGDVDHAAGETGRAKEYYILALESLEHQLSKVGGSYHIQARFRTHHRGYYRDALEILLAQGQLSEALHVLERFRAQTFLAMLTERDTVFTSDIPEDLDQKRRRVAVLYDRALKELAALNPRDHSIKIETTRRELQKLNDEAGDIEAHIRQTSPRLAALKYPRPLDTAKAQVALDPGTLLISYSVSKDTTALFVLSRSGNLEVRILPLGEKALRSQVEQLLSLIREAGQGSSLEALRQKRLQAASRNLYVALLGPVAERIAASKRLLILPDGPLHALPFAALARNDGAVNSVQYLAEWKPVHVALSLTVFAELKQRRRPAGENDSSQTPIQIAAFGDPVYPQSFTKPKQVALPTTNSVISQIDPPRIDPIVRSAAERGIFDWQPLPYTRHEVEGITSLFPMETTRTFLGSEALEDKIKNIDPKTRILHLAAHGYTDEHLPTSSFIALTIPEDTTSANSNSERDNGLLQVWEIFERVRLDADLVVLSACDSGLGEEQGGEGLIGLTRAFQYAGARTVMASLWSVQDQATSELMIRFYKYLRAGKPKDEALRQAQIELIRSPIEIVNEKGGKTLFDASAPYYWAGFQVYGDWQ